MLRPPRGDLQFIKWADSVSPTAFLLLFVSLAGVLVVPMLLHLSREGSFSDRPVPNVKEQVEWVATGTLENQVAILALGAICAAWALRRPLMRLHLNGASGWSMLVYWIWLALSVTWANNTWLTGRTIVRTSITVFAALAIAQKLSIRDLARLNGGMCALPLALGLCVEVYQGTIRPWDPAWRLAGVLHPVTQGWNSGLLLLAALALALGSKQLRARYLWVAGAAGIFLMLTRSRVAFVAALLAAAVYIGLLVGRRLRWAIGGFALVCACIVFLGVVITGSVLQEETRTVASFGRGTEGEASVETLTGRLPLWSECLRMVARRPLLGYGYNAFLDEDLYVEITKGAGWPASSPHSGYIEALLGLGVVGAGALVWVLISAMKRAVALSRTNPAYAYLAAVVSWLAVNLVTESYLMTSPQIPTLVAIACLAKISVFPEEPAE